MMAWRWRRIATLKSRKKGKEKRTPVQAPVIGVLVFSNRVLRLLAM